MVDLIPWTRREREGLPTAYRREFEDLVRRFFGEEPLGAAFPKEFSPAVDLAESENEFLLQAELPGVDPQELDVTLTGDVLTIKGEKKEEREEKSGGYHRVERHFGSFSRSFKLPCPVQEEKIQAKYADGVLTITIPKAEADKKKAIQIEIK